MPFFLETEKYPCSVLRQKENCNTFEDLQYILDKKKNKMEWSFPRISNPPHHGLLISSNLIWHQIPILFLWNLVGIQYIQNWCPINLSLHYQRCILLLVLQEKNHWKISVQQVLALHAQHFARVLEKNVVLKFANRFSWTLHKICRYEGFLWAKFSHIWTESKDIYERIYIRENPNLCTFYPVLGILLINLETNIIEQEY